LTNNRKFVKIQLHFPNIQKERECDKKGSVMKKSFYTLLFAIFMIPAPKAVAAELPWQGAQIQAGIGGSIPVHGEAIALRASGMLFTVPENKLIMFFSYAGPVFAPVEWFWIAPQIGYAANWMETDAGIGSVWIGFSFFQGKLTIFTENEAIFNHKKADYYGYHAVDYNPLDWVNAGIQVEAVNRLATFGPHIGFSKGPWHFEVQWHVGAQEENLGHAVRIFTCLNF